MGMYLSAHPLDEYKMVIESTCKCSLADLGDLEKFRGKEVAVAGIVTDVREFYLKNGTPAVEAYMNFLKSGCTQDPVSLLKIAGVNLETPQPIQDAFDVLDEILTEMESLA